MNEEEILSLNTYIEELYQAMQIGDIKFEPKHSSELYNLINRLLKENQQLKEEFDRVFAVYQSRKLIKKFNDEYDEEDKTKNPNRDYACICPDAEEVYKRYYELKEQLQQKEDILDKIKDCVEEFLCSEYYCSQGLELHDFCVKILKILDNKGE